MKDIFRRLEEAANSGPIPIRDDVLTASEKALDTLKREMKRKGYTFRKSKQSELHEWSWTTSEKPLEVRFVSGWMVKGRPMLFSASRTPKGGGNTEDFPGTGLGSSGWLWDKMDHDAKGPTLPADVQDMLKEKIVKLAEWILATA